MGRKSTIGRLVMEQAKFNATVADIAKETGAKPNTVRAVLRRAADKGSIHLVRFYRGRSSRAIRVISHSEDVEANLSGLICGLCGKVAK